MAFSSVASNLVEGEADINGYGAGIFVFDMTTGVMTNITNGANLGSYEPRFSADGTKVVFESSATTLVEGEPDHNGTNPDIFIHDLTPGVTANVTNGSNGGSYHASISGDGSTVAFTSGATNLVPNDDGSDFSDIFVFEV